MAKFEVHIPGAAQGLNITLRVEADHWMAALKTGMKKLGEQGVSAQNILVDVQDDLSIHITEPLSGRVFRLRELSDEEAAQGSVRAGAPKPGAAVDPAVALAAIEQVSRPMPLASADLPSKEESAVPHAGEPPVEAGDSPIGHRGPASINEPRQVVELAGPMKPVALPIGRVARPKQRSVTLEDVLSDVFERVQEVYSRPTVEDGLYYLLDLALEKIRAEAGSVYRADASTGDLTFAAVRGPKAKELSSAKLVIPSGTGIVGFCALEGVSLAVSDVEKDPRFYKAISERLEYPARSILCAPMMTHGRTFGCIQLINRIGDQLFPHHEVGMLAYIAHQAALYLNNAG